MSEQADDVQCESCGRWFRSRGGLAVHTLKMHDILYILKVEFDYYILLSMAQCALDRASLFFHWTAYLEGTCAS